MLYVTEQTALDRDHGTKESRKATQMPTNFLPGTTTRNNQNAPVARYYLENAWPSATGKPVISQEGEIVFESIQR